MLVAGCDSSSHSRWARRLQAAALTPSTTTAFDVVVEKAPGVCVTTKPAGTLLSGNGSMRDRNPACWSSEVAADWESPTTFGTVIVASTLDLVVEVVTTVELRGAVVGGSLAEPGGAVDLEPASPLRTSAMTATTRAITAITVERLGRRVLARPAITRALKTSSAKTAVATSPATRPAAKVTPHSYVDRGASLDRAVDRVAFHVAADLGEISCCWSSAREHSDPMRRPSFAVNN